MSRLVWLPAAADPVEDLGQAHAVAAVCALDWINLCGDLVQVAGTPVELVQGSLDDEERTFTPNGRRRTVLVRVIGLMPFDYMIADELRDLLIRLRGNLSGSEEAVLLRLVDALAVPVEPD